jgi:hypothetical protein
MKVLDFQKVQEIDSHIQDLLSELSTLYRERNEIFSGADKETKAKKNRRIAQQSTTTLENLDFSTFDLSLKD